MLDHAGARAFCLAIAVGLMAVLGPAAGAKNADPLEGRRFDDTEALDVMAGTRGRAVLIAAARGDTAAGPFERGAALVWLTRLHPAQGRRIADEALSDDGAPRIVQEMAMMALAELDDPRAVQRLARFVSESRDCRLREEALFWLATLASV